MRAGILMKLIDKEDDAALSLRGFREHGLNARCKFVAGARAFGQRVKTQTKDSLIAQTVRDIAKRNLNRHAASNRVAVEIGFADDYRSFRRCRQTRNYARHISVAIASLIELAVQRQQR